MRWLRKRGAKQPTERGRILEILNTTAEPLVVYVEMYPDRYILHPGSLLEIEANLNGAPFHLLPFTGGLTVYPGNDVGPPVKIDGQLVEPDWETGVVTAGGPDPMTSA